MEYIYMAIEWCGWQGVALGALLVILYFVQMGYYCGSFARLPKYRFRGGESERATQLEPISVVMPLYNEDYQVFKETIPAILAQRGVDFELVIVYVGNDKSYYEDLKTLSDSLREVTITRILREDGRHISTKLALNIGIKSALYENIIFAESGSQICSARWLASMAEGFTRGDIVLGYGSWERGGGLFGSLIRLDRMIEASLAISSALMGISFRGWINNMGITRKAYFASRGFSHLNLEQGIDDLFIQNLAKEHSTSIILSPALTVRSPRWGGAEWWLEMMSRYSRTFALYPERVKRRIRRHTFSGNIFLLLSLVAIILMPLWFKLGALSLLLTRWIWAMVSLARISSRLGEGAIYWLLPLYEVIRPLGGLRIWIKTMKKEETQWS